jgi:hypothetical protein
VRALARRSANGSHSRHPASRGISASVHVSALGVAWGARGCWNAMSRTAIWLAGDAMEAGPLDELLGHSITYRIAGGPHAGRKVFTLQTLPSCNEPFDATVGKVAGS